MSIKFNENTLGIDMPCGSEYGHVQYVSQQNVATGAYNQADIVTEHLVKCELCPKWHVLRIDNHKGHLTIEWLC